MRKKFGIVFLPAILIRLLSLNQSLWLDEAITAKVVRSFPLFDIASRFSPGDFHPPLYYIFMKMWTLVFGMSEIALRFPSVIFSVLTGHAIFLIGSRIKNERFGLLAAALFLYNPLSVYYAQEARMYSLVTMLLTFALYFLLNIVVEHKPEHRGIVHRVKNLLTRAKKILIRPSHKLPEDSPELLLSANGYRLSLVMLNILLVLAVWTFYGSYFFVAACLVLFLLRKKYRECAITAGVIFVSFLLQYPLIREQMMNAQRALAQVPFWTAALGGANLKNFLLIFIKFAFGRISFLPKAVYYVIAGLWTVFVFSYVLLGSLKDRRLAVMFFVPLILGVLFSFFTPMLQYFRFLYLLPMASILIMVGIENYINVKKKKGLFAFFRKERSKKFIDHLRENAVVEILLGMFMFLSLLTLLVPQYQREDWKSLVKALPPGQSVYMIRSSSDPFTYYSPKAEVRDLRDLERDWLYEKQVYVIPYAAEIYGVKYQDNLHKMGCFEGQRVMFNGGVYFEVWECGKIG